MLDQSPAAFLQRADAMVGDGVDPLDAMTRSAIPVVPAPAYGACPVYDELLAAEDHHGFVIGKNALTLVVRRPWLEANIQVAEWRSTVVPFGEGPEPGATLRCGPVPSSILTGLVGYFRACLPDEGAAFVTWSREFGFAMRPAVARSASPSHINYEVPPLADGEFVVVDAHSHGRAGAFFSATDNEDDAGATKCSLVFGRLEQDEPEVALRLMVMGIARPIGLALFGAGEKPVRLARSQQLRPQSRAPELAAVDEMPAGADAIIEALSGHIVNAALNRAGTALISMSYDGETADAEEHCATV